MKGDEYVLIYWWFFEYRCPSTNALHFSLPLKRGLGYYHQTAMQTHRGASEGAPH